MSAISGMGIIYNLVGNNFMEIFLTFLLGAVAITATVGVLWVIGWVVDAGEDDDCKPYVGAIFVCTIALVLLILYLAGVVARELFTGVLQK
jgi:hypothetical protein